MELDIYSVDGAVPSQKKINECHGTVTLSFFFCNGFKFNKVIIMARGLHSSHSLYVFYRQKRFFLLIFRVCTPHVVANYIFPVAEHFFKFFFNLSVRRLLCKWDKRFDLLQ